MAKQTVNIGTSVNKGNGDPLRTAFTKINNNFDELYSALGSDGDLFDPSSVDQSLVPTTTNTVDLGSASKQWRSLYVSNNTIYIGGVAIGVDGNGNLTSGGTAVGSTPAWDNITGKPTFAAVATSNSYADLSNKPTIPTDIGDLTDTGNLLLPQTTLDGDVTGSIFADDSTLLVDGVNGKIVGDVETSSLRTSETKIALGADAGQTSQGGYAVAVGYAAGQTSQGLRAVSVGPDSGSISQGDVGVAIGYAAGQSTQGIGAIAIGNAAGNIGQGNYAIAIGVSAGVTSQAANSIVINASGAALNNTTASSFVVKPVRGVAEASLPSGFKPVAYNPTTGEFIYYDA